MIATLTALALATCMLFLGESAPQTAPLLLSLMTMGTHLLLLTLPLYWTFSTLALQRGEKRLGPKLFECFQKNRLFSLYEKGIFLFLLLSYTSLSGHFFWVTGPAPSFFPFWLVGFGCALDGFYQLYKGVAHHVNPIQGVEIMKEHAGKEAKLGQEEKATQWIDAFATLANKATKQEEVALAERATSASFQTLSTLVEHRLEHHLDQEKLSYAFIYFSQRMESIFRRANQAQAEGLSLHVMNQLGKATVLGAEVAGPLSTLPLVYVSKLLEMSKQHNLAELPDQVSCLLVEVARLLLHQGVELGVSYQEPMASILHTLEEIEMEKFTKNKEIEFDILKKPFKDLVGMMGESQIMEHPDTPSVLAQIERIVGDFSNLELVMGKKLAEESSAP